MKKLILDYQSKDFDFPEVLYVGSISVTNSQGEKQYLCLTRVFNNIEILKQYVLFVIDDLSNSSNDVTPSYEGLITRCDFSRLFPLNKSHWAEKPSINMDIYQKFRNDDNITKYWQMNEILVTPDGEIDGVEFYSFCISFVKETPGKDVDLFINNSNQVVDIRAKNAAFYTIEKPIKINWLEGKNNINGFRSAKFKIEI